jgi:hypothetical protein
VEGFDLEVGELGFLLLEEFADGVDVLALSQHDLEHLGALLVYLLFLHEGFEL